MTYFCLQLAITPNGLIAHLLGPIEGQKHDAFKLVESGLLDKLQPLSLPNVQPHIVYGDPAYGVTLTILCTFCGQQLTRTSRERFQLKYEFSPCFRRVLIQKDNSTVCLSGL